MIIKEARIDDRLIHGQIVTAWIQETKARAILVADDKAAADPFQQSMLKLAVPQGIQLIIKPLKDAAALIARDTSAVGVLLIARTPMDAQALLRMGFKPERWTLGNITGRKSEQQRVSVLKYVFATQADADSLMALHDAGIHVVAQSVPNESGYEIVELLRKAGFYKQV